MTDRLGPFREGFASWRKVLGTVPAEAQLKIFGNAVEDVATYVSKGLDRATAADELADMAQSIGFEDTDQVQLVISDAFAQIERPEIVPDDWSDYDQPKPNGGGQPLINGHAATKYMAPDPAGIPRRAWLYGGHYVRQTASATVAPGGYGKTTLQLYEAIEMVRAGLKVWYLSGEDPRVELDRRIAAHCTKHNTNLTKLPGQLFVDDRASFELFIAKSPRVGQVQFDEMSLLRFETAITTDKIDVVILDPFVSFHTVPENDNNAIDAVIKILAAIGRRTNSAIEISHHVRKSNTMRGETLTIDDARGGSAIINAVRSGRVINRMSADEASAADIEQNTRHSYVRIDIGKHNMAPPPERATWYKLVSVAIANGDKVQALTSYKYSAIAGLTLDDTDFIADLVRKKPYRVDTRSADWLGIPLAERLKLDKDDKKTVIKMQGWFGSWIQSGVLVKRTLKDGESRKRYVFYCEPDGPRTDEVIVVDEEGDQ